jgi:hypothetical protein
MGNDFIPFTLNNAAKIIDKQHWCHACVVSVIRSASLSRYIRCRASLSYQD